MTDRWLDLRLGDAARKIGSGATPKGGKEAYLDQGPFALIRSQNVYNDHFSFPGLAYINDEQARALSNVAVEPADVLLNITGDSVARCAQVDPSVLPARVNQHVAIIRTDLSRLDARFLRYYLISPTVQQHLHQLASAGATRPALTKAMLESLSVFAPASVAQQRAIASILGALDDKIELNRKMSATLEAMARAIFTSWFVDFDPVRAKSAGRDTGLAPEIDALFPNTFEESSIGHVPTGWTLKALSDVTTETLGGDWGETKPTSKKPVPTLCMRGTDIPSIQDGGLGRMPVRYVSESSIAKRALIAGDIIIEISGGTPTQSTGRCAFISGDLLARFDVHLAYSNFCRVIRSASPDLSIYFYRLLRLKYSQDDFFQFENGTSGIKNLDLKFLSRSLFFAMPPKSLLSVFNNTYQTILKKQQLNGAENDVLADIRDALLPKLISGELRVSDAERILGMSA